MKKAKRTFKQNRIFTQNNPLSPRICPELASEIGIDKSILLLQYEFWIATEGEERDGHLWIRKTVREIKQVFSFWSTSTINRIINKLVDGGYMIAEALDEGDRKNGRWLRFGFDRLGTLKSIKIICAETGQTFVPEQDSVCANLRQTTSQDETNNGSSPYIEERDQESNRKQESAFITSLRTDSTYSHIDLDFELGKMRRWLSLSANTGRKLTDKFVLHWLNKIERPLNFGDNSSNGHRRSQADIAREMGYEYDG